MSRLRAPGEVLLAPKAVPVNCPRNVGSGRSDGTGGAVHEVLPEREPQNLPCGTVHREVHPGDSAVDRYACGLAHQLFEGVDRLARIGRTEQLPQHIGNDVRLGGVAAGQAAVPRRLDHRLQLGRHLHRSPAGQRMLEAHLGMIGQPQRCPHQFERPLVALRIETEHRGPEHHRRRQLRQDLVAALRAQVGPVGDETELALPKSAGQAACTVVVVGRAGHAHDAVCARRRRRRGEVANPDVPQRLVAGHAVKGVGSELQPRVQLEVDQRRAHPRLPAAEVGQALLRQLRRVLRGVDPAADDAVTMRNQRLRVDRGIAATAEATEPTKAAKTSEASEASEPTKTAKSPKAAEPPESTLLTHGRSPCSS